MNRRVNTVSWSDGEVLTRLMGDLQNELMKWQKNCAREDPENRGLLKPLSEIHTFAGDSGVIISAINLRSRLDQIITRSSEKNSHK